MDELSHPYLFDFFMGPMLSCIGIVITVYYGTIYIRKKMNYRVARKKKSIIIAFWNASRQVIREADLYYLRIHSNEDIEIKKIYADDEEIPLEINSPPGSLPPNEGRDYDLSFDFLLRHHGFIIQINRKDNGKLTFPIELKGRIRGEKKSSISLSQPKDLLSAPEIMPRALLILYITYFISIAAIQTGYILDMMIIAIPAIVLFFVVILLSLGAVIVFFVNEILTSFFVPKAIKKEFNKRIRNEKYIEDKITITKFLHKE